MYQFIFLLKVITLPIGERGQSWIAMCLFSRISSPCTYVFNCIFFPSSPSIHHSPESPPPPSTGVGGKKWKFAPAPWYKFFINLVFFHRSASRVFQAWIYIYLTTFQGSWQKLLLKFAKFLVASFIFSACQTFAKYWCFVPFFAPLPGNKLQTYLMVTILIQLF